MAANLSEFRTACIVQVSESDGMFVLVQDFIYRSARAGKDIVVPVGFETDFASIPQIFHSIVEVNGKHRRAAVVHDYLCIHGAKHNISQREADYIFWEAMEVCDTRVTQSTVMFGMVRVYQSIKGMFKR